MQSREQVYIVVRKRILHNYFPYTVVIGVFKSKNKALQVAAEAAIKHIDNIVEKYPSKVVMKAKPEEAKSFQEFWGFKQSLDHFLCQNGTIDIDEFWACLRIDCRKHLEEGEIEKAHEKICSYFIYYVNENIDEEEKCFFEVEKSILE